jgi:hypothetical protein
MNPSTTRVVSLVLAFGAPAACAGVVASGIDTEAGGIGGQHTSMEFFAFSLAQGLVDKLEVDLTTNLDAGSAGMTFVASAGTDPDWDAYAARMSNGLNDHFGWGVLFPGIGGAKSTNPESLVFDGFAPAGHPDFVGFSITELRVTILRASLMYDANNDFTNWSVNFSWELHAVPAPGALALAGLCGLAATRRVRRA